MQNREHAARRRSVARAYRRAVRHGNALDAGWLATVTEPARVRH